MRAPRLGFGWKDVAFYGRSPPDSTRAWTCSKSGFGSSTAGEVVLVAARASSRLWWCSILGAGTGSRGRTRSCSHDTAAPRSRSLQWPNDVLLSGAKLAGSLLERAGEAAVVGIGVNLAAAPHLPDRPARHLARSGPAPDRDLFAHQLAASFDRELDRWRQFGLAPILSRWLAAAHPVGSPLAVHGADGSRAAGAFDGLEPDGALRLRLADGSARVIHAGDVSLEGN